MAACYIIITVRGRHGKKEWEILIIPQVWSVVLIWQRKRRRENETGFFDSFFTIIRKCQAQLKIRESDRCRDERPRTHTSAALRIHRISISSSRGEDLSFFVLFLIYDASLAEKWNTNLCSMSERKRHSSFLSCRPNDTRKDKKKIIITKQIFRKIVMNTTSNEDFRAVFFFSYRARSTFHAQMFFSFLRFSFFYFAYCPDVYVLWRKNRRLLDNWTLLGWVRLFALSSNNTVTIIIAAAGQ